MDIDGFKTLIERLFQLDDEDIDIDLGWRDNLISSIEITELVAELEKELGPAIFHKDSVNRAVKDNATLRELLQVAKSG